MLYVTTSASFLAKILVESPRKNYLFPFSKKDFSGCKYPKNILFDFENRSTGYHAILGGRRQQPLEHQWSTS